MTSFSGLNDVIARVLLSRPPRYIDTEPSVSVFVCEAETFPVTAASVSCDNNLVFSTKTQSAAFHMKLQLFRP